MSTIPVAPTPVPYDERRFRGSAVVPTIVLALLLVPLLLGYEGPTSSLLMALGDVVWVPLRQLRTLWDLPSYGFSAAIDSPLEFTVLPFVGGLALAAAVGAVWCGFQRRLLEAGLCLLGFVGLSVALLVAARGGFGFLPGAAESAVYLGYLSILGALGVSAIVMNQSRQFALGVLPPESARAVWRSERRAQQIARVEDPRPDAPVGSAGGSLAGDASMGEYATFGSRLGARMLDALVMLLILPLGAAAAAGVAAAMGVDDVAPIVIAAVLVDLPLGVTAYYLVGASRGQTLGKQNIGLRLCRMDGRPLGFWLAVGRELASIISTMALMIGWLAPLWTPKRQTWHDSMTNTVVVRDRASRLARAAIVWALVWTVIGGAGFGALGATVLDDLDTGGSGGTSYYDETDYYGDGYCDFSDYYDPDC